MFNQYGLRFAEYFGFLLQEYVGEILRNSVPISSLVGEEEIRTTYPDDRGPTPDWIVLEGSHAVLIECKATRFSRAALATGNETAIDSSLKQMLKGLRQCIKFKNACQNGQVGLERFFGLSEFKIALVSLEPLLLVNSHFFRQHINQILPEEGLPNDEWIAASAQELEILQPHVAAGIGLSEPLSRLRTETAFFLYEQDRELYERLGVHPE